MGRRVWSGLLGGRVIAALALTTVAVCLARSASSVSGGLSQLPGQSGCLGEPGQEDCALARGFLYAESVVVSSDGRNAYVGSMSGGVAVFTRDRLTGVLHQLAGRQGCLSGFRNQGCGRMRGIGGAESVAVSPDGRNLYAADYNGVAVFARDRLRGVLHQLGGRRGCAHPGARMAAPAATRS